MAASPNIDYFFPALTFLDYLFEGPNPFLLQVTNHGAPGTVAVDIDAQPAIMGSLWRHVGDSCFSPLASGATGTTAPIATLERSDGLLRVSTHPSSNTQIFYIVVV